MSTKYVYRNISTSTQSLVGVGLVNSNDEVSLAFKVENPNFKLIKTSKVDSESKVGVIPVAKSKSRK